MFDLALLEFSYRDRRTVYWSKAEQGALSFLSAPAILIQGIYELNPEMARKILRERIYTSAPMTDALHAMVKVCAKRIDVNVSLDGLQNRISTDAVEVRELPPPAEAPKPLVAAPMEQARWLAQTVSRESKLLYERDRAIGAVLVSAAGELLAHAVNTNARNRTCHAEMNLLRQLSFGGIRAIPREAKLYVTRKPCKMCAAMILSFCEDPKSNRVIYDEDDPGTNAQRTALDLSPYPIQERFGS